MGPREGETFTGALSRHALEALEWNWGEAYEIGVTGDGLWHAKRRDGLGGMIDAAGPEDLKRAIKDDYAMMPVPRAAPGPEVAP